LIKLGEIEVHVLTDGTLRLDGGAMFGVVPKPLWEKKAPADERNRILLAMNILLIRAAGKWILVETGAGDKWPEKLVDIYAFEKPPRLLDKLADHGLTPEKIDIVINTHLHFDHCGWNTRVLEGKLRPTFANATYYVQRGEFEHAKSPTDRDRASYVPENFLPIEDAGQWQFLDYEEEIVPGVRVVRAPGHTRDMQCVLVSGGGHTLFFMADLAPTAAHLPFPWVMGYDLYPLTTLDSKKKWLPRAVREGWIVAFAHDPHTPIVRLKEGAKGTIEAEPRSF
jgi:glyoxylase-like metal-dependent hydrolase (beta-lactamase superfamily II)